MHFSSAEKFKNLNVLKSRQKNEIFAVYTGKRSCFQPGIVEAPGVCEVGCFLNNQLEIYSNRMASLQPCLWIVETVPLIHRCCWNKTVTPWQELHCHKCKFCILAAPE